MLKAISERAGLQVSFLLNKVMLSNALLSVQKYKRISVIYIIKNIVIKNINKIIVK